MLPPEPATDPTLRALHEPVTHGALRAALEAFVTSASLLKILGGAAATMLLLASTIAGFTVRHTDERSAKTEQRVERHEEDDNAQFQQLRKENADNFGRMESVLTEMRKETSKTNQILLENARHRYAEPSVEADSRRAR